MGNFSVAIPYQFYNLIMVFVTILALLWGMVAIKRVYRMLRVRSAVLSDRIIQIRGLGSYLTYFDGATRMHLEAVVHTRQSMPPVVMDPLLVSAVSKGLSISGGLERAKFSLSLNIQALHSSRVICLIDFRDGNFQRMAQQVKADSNDATQSRSQLFYSLTGLRDNAAIGPSATFPRFQRGECCIFECLCAELGPGEHSLALPLLPIMNSWLGDRLAAPAAPSGDEKVTIAVMLVRNGAETRGGAPSKSPGGARAAGSTAFALEEGDGDSSEAGSPEEEPLHGAGHHTPAKARWQRGEGRQQQQRAAAGRNPMVSASARGEDAQADASAPTSAFAAVFSHSFSLQSLRAASAANTGEWRVAAPACDALVLDGRGQLYQSQEVFGLSPVLPSSPQQAAAPAAATPSTGNASATDEPGAVAGAASCGGCLVAEDCVVCLTVPKEVLLLPCRHLCVCESCLVFLDKCPVCRAAFEEYIAIRAPPTAQSTAHAAAQASNAPVNNGSTGLSPSTSTGTALESIDASVLQI